MTTTYLPPDQRFIFTEINPCTCKARQFNIYDLMEKDNTTAHVGTLDPHNLAHKELRKILHK